MCNKKNQQASVNITMYVQRMYSVYVYVYEYEEKRKLVFEQTQECLGGENF